MSSRTTTTISTVVATTTKLSLSTMPPCRWQQPELSIGPRCQSLDVLGVYKCWSLKDKSPAHLVWNKVYKAIITLVEDQFEHLDARDSDLVVEMFMIGRKARTSSPTVLFSCESKSCRRKVIELVQKNSILACHPGISMAECSRLPRLLAFGEGLEMPILPPGVYVNGPLRSCGIDVLISGSHDKSPRKATIGGLVCVDDDYYGLTCAHAFSEAKEPDASGDRDLEFAFYGPDDPDDSSDGENDSVGMTSQGKKGLGQNSPLPPSTDSISTDQDPPPTNPREISDTNEFTKPVLLGTLFAKTAPGLSFDWALVKIEHPDFLIPHTTSSNLDLDIMVNKISSRGRVLCPKHIAHPLADARVLVCTGSIDGTYEGTLSTVASFMKAPGSEKFQEMWTVRCPDGSFCKLAT
ncbi:uncharacterized protein PAC_18237 [Phialocephala subalpina]|uniref:Uncharacterized protein n=1 Tax=Phialocephala subalpina TaxID=576137 RepID=A0A1L7XTN2_9HELO|nr:uncharacterized protein PAC_18237 [Phialocephala subalpina]